jgi:hypothetical protein
MKIRHSQIAAICLLSAAPLFCAAAPAGITHIQEAIEASRIEVMGANHDHLHVYKCERCAPQVMQLDAHVEIIRHGRAEPFKVLLNNGGKPATVIYDLKSGNVVKVVVY